jgi:hypothetical protein
MACLLAAGEICGRDGVAIDCRGLARQVLVNVSALSEARFHESVKSGEVLRARSIEPFAGGRWRLRRMRASGCTDLTAMGIESFFVCSLLILLGLGESGRTENRS